MQDPVRLTDITLVIYPSNHVLVSAPKIVLIGSGQQWKDEVIKEANNYWTDSSVLFYYLDEESIDSDKLSWLYLNIKEADFIIGRLTPNIDDISIISPFISLKKTFCMFDTLSQDLTNWFVTLNPNKDHNNPLSIILEIKHIWSTTRINT